MNESPWLNNVPSSSYNDVEGFSINRIELVSSLFYDRICLSLVAVPNNE